MDIGRWLFRQSLLTIAEIEFPHSNHFLCVTQARILDRLRKRLSRQALRVWHNVALCLPDERGACQWLGNSVAHGVTDGIQLPGKYAVE